MNAGLWMGVAGYALLMTAMGALLVRAFCFPRDPLVHGWAHAYLVGQTVAMILTLATRWLPVSISTIRWAVMALTAGGWIYGLWRGGLTKRDAGTVFGGLLAWTALAAVVFPIQAVVLHGSPVVGWDARSIWFFHAKAIHAAGGIDPEFFANPLYGWSHLDYPLSIPAQGAWSLWGGWNEYACRAFLLVNLAAILRLCVGAVRGIGLPRTLSMVVAVLIVDRGGMAMVDGYADQHYAAFLVLALLFLVSSNRKVRFPLVVTLLGCAAGLKQEGCLYAALLAAGWGAVCVVRRCGKGHDMGLVPAGAAQRWGWVALLAVTPVLLWLAFRAGTYVRAEDAAIWPSLDGLRELPERLIDRGATIVRAMGLIYASRHLPVFAGAIGMVWLARCLAARRLGRRTLLPSRREAVFLLAFLVINAVTFTMFIFTPFDLGWHMGTAAERLLVPADWLMTALGVLSIEPLVRLFVRGTCRVEGERSIDERSGDV